MVVGFGVVLLPILLLFPKLPQFRLSLEPLSQAIRALFFIGGLGKLKRSLPFNRGVKHRACMRAANVFVVGRLDSDLRISDNSLVFVSYLF